MNEGNAEVGRDEGRGGDATSCHELQVSGRNGGNGRGCRELPIACRIWRRWGEGEVAVTWQELLEIGRDEGRREDAASCLDLPKNGRNDGF